MLALWYNGISARVIRTRAAANVNRQITQKAKSLYRLLLSATKYLALCLSKRSRTIALSFCVAQ